MYSRKSVGPRMEPCTIPVLTGYYCWWVGGTGVEQKVLFRANRNYIFCVPGFIQGWTMQGKPKISSFCF